MPLQSSTQRHIDQTQMLSGSLLMFKVTDTNTNAWDTADNTQKTLRNICQGVQAVANLVMIGKPNDAAHAGLNALNFCTENHGENKDNIQEAIRTATGHGTDVTVADFKY